MWGNSSQRLQSARTLGEYCIGSWNFWTLDLALVKRMCVCRKGVNAPSSPSPAWPPPQGIFRRGSAGMVEAWHGWLLFIRDILLQDPVTSTVRIFWYLLTVVIGFCVLLPLSSLFSAPFYVYSTVWNTSVYTCIYYGDCTYFLSGNKSLRNQLYALMICPPQ